MSQVTLRSPAKLNLFLKIINKRPDGYHNIETLFERIDLCDDIRLTSNPNGGIRIFCDHPHVPIGKKNLAYQAADILKKDCHAADGVDIKITKRIPVAAGLAGGSSNAATVLLGLNRIWGLSLSKRRLLAYGRLLGADVPFFLHDCSWGLGLNRGDQIKRLFCASKVWHILVVPRAKMYSGEVFTRLNLQLTKTSDNVNILIHHLRKNDFEGAENLLFNELESSILQIRPALFRVKERLQSCALKHVAFSGSGPAVFGLTKSKQEAETLKSVLSKKYSQVFAVRTL